MFLTNERIVDFCQAAKTQRSKQLFAMLLMLVTASRMGQGSFLEENKKMQTACGGAAQFEHSINQIKSKLAQKLTNIQQAQLDLAKLGLAAVADKSSMAPIYAAIASAGNRLVSDAQQQVTTISEKALQGLQQLSELRGAELTVADVDVLKLNAVPDFTINSASLPNTGIHLRLKPITAAKPECEETKYNKRSAQEGPPLNDDGPKLTFFHLSNRAPGSTAGDGAVLCGHTGATGVNCASATQGSATNLHVTEGKLTESKAQVYLRDKTSTTEYTAKTPSPTALVPTQKFVTDRLTGIKALQPLIETLNFKGTELREITITQTAEFKRLAAIALLPNYKKDDETKRSDGLKTKVDTTVSANQGAFDKQTWSSLEDISISAEAQDSEAATTIKTLNNLGKIGVATAYYISKKRQQPETEHTKTAKGSTNKTDAADKTKEDKDGDNKGTVAANCTSHSTQDACTKVQNCKWENNACKDSSILVSKQFASMVSAFVSFVAL
uniref:Variant surface glycoprotein 1125.4213 n=1 Tax=Trypanosoma brucei TaxID=5691 RepID=A0A1J0RAC4_9TRYP|nr:variant surface glycoprotein 1125.4213 [Trypanosoma brucei]